MRSLILLSLFLFVTVPFFGSYSLTDYPFKSKYDVSYAKISDYDTIVNGLDDQDQDVVYSALKRAGQLKITNIRVKVESIIGSASPIANQGKAVQSTSYRHVFNMGILVLGKIGDESDGPILANYLKDTKDKIGIICILRALGDLTTSKFALETLNAYTYTMDSKTDSRVVREMVDAMVVHNSRTSMGPLLWLKGKVQSQDKSYINEAIKTLDSAPRNKEK